MRVVTVDVGGSGVKSAMLDDGVLVDPPRRTSHAELDIARLPSWLRDRYPGPVDAIGIALPGMIAEGGERVRIYVAPRWRTLNLAEAIRTAFGVPRVVLMNDAEAAAIAAVGEGGLPLVHLTLGTGPGMAAIDTSGRLVRPHAGGSFTVSTFDIAGHGQAWQALAATTLAALEETRGRDQAMAIYADRIAILARGLATMFQPRSITLSGGVAASEPALASRVQARLARRLPAWHGPTFGIPVVRTLPDPAHAAFRGLDRLIRGSAMEPIGPLGS